MDHRFIKQITNLPKADQNSSDNFFLLQSCNFHFSSLLCCVFVCICAYVFVCVSVCNICVCPLEFVGQFNSQVCLRLGSWLIRQTEASCKLKSVNNQRRHNLYIHFHHYQTLTTEIMVLYQYSLAMFVFGDFNILRVSLQIVYLCTNIFFGSVGVFNLQTWQSYSLSLTQWSWIVVVWSGQPQAQLAKSKSVNCQPRQHRQRNQKE